MSCIRRCAFLGIRSATSLLTKNVKLKLKPFNSLMIHSGVVLDSQSLKIKMPSLSPTMTEGTIVKWLKQEGETIAPGDALCEIETDKAVVAFETEEEGILSKILVPENTKKVKLGEVIAVMTIDGDSEAGSDSNRSSESIKPSEPTSDKWPKLCGPSVRNLLEEFGIKYSLVKHTGPRNNLIKGDVLTYIRANNLKPKVKVSAPIEVSKIPDVTFIETSSFIDIPHTSMRQIIAKRLTQSKTTIPHAYASIDSNINNILEYRKHMKKDGINVSINDFVIKCAATVLTQVPQVNAIYMNEGPKLMKSVDISFAVSTDSGLITPIIKSADILSVQEISEQARSLAGKAREGKLKPEEFQGGSFCISNLGMFGISEFSAVINPPQCAILAVGTSRFVLEEEMPVTKIKATLSFDSRAIDESTAAQFLNLLKGYLEKPTNMLV